MSRLVTISKVGDTTVVKIVDNGKPTILNCNSSRDLQLTDNGVLITNDPNEMTLNNFEIKISELTNNGIDFSAVVTPEDLLNVLAVSKAFKYGGGLGEKEVETLILLQQADAYGNKFVGFIKHLQNLDYRVFVTATLINGVLDKVPYTFDITLAVSEPFNRLDVPLANINRTVTVLKGDASINQIEPTEYDSLTSVKIGIILVTANSTEPVGVTNIVVFNENLGTAGGEFSAVTYNNPARIDFNNLEQKSSGLKSIKYTDFVGANFKNGVVKYEGKDLSDLSFKIFLTTVNVANLVRCQLWVNSTMRIGVIDVSHGQFNFDATKINQFQQVVIPAAAFNSAMGNYQFDEIIITNRKTGSTFYIDDIKMQFNGGVQQVTQSPHPTVLSAFTNDVGYVKTSDIPIYTYAIVANQLKVYKNLVEQTSLDLSLYLDDTNLARLVSATINGAGLATFTRDDTSTFTLDLSNLLDNQIASEVPFTPEGGISATNVQDAIIEVKGAILPKNLYLSTGHKINNYELAKDNSLIHRTGATQEVQITALNDAQLGGLHGFRYVQKYDTLFATDRSTGASTLLYKFHNPNDLTQYTTVNLKQAGYFYSDQLVYSAYKDKLYAVMGDGTNWTGTFIKVVEIDPVTLAITNVISYNTGGSIGTAILITLDDHLYVATTYFNSKVVKFNLDTYAYVSQVIIADSNNGAHAIVTDGTKLYITSTWNSANQFVVRINPITMVIEQTMNWTFPYTGSASGITDDILLIGDYLYLPLEGFTNNFLFKVKASNLSENNVIKIENGGISNIWAITYDGTNIWYAGTNKLLGSFNPETGENYLYTSPFTSNINELQSDGQRMFVAGFNIYPVLNTGYVGRMLFPDKPIRKTVLNIAGEKVYTVDYATGIISMPNTTIVQINTAGAKALTNKEYVDAQKPYKVYTALLSQIGTSAPSVIILENTIGNIVWSRVDIGEYSATLNGVFIVNKTTIFLGGLINQGASSNPGFWNTGSQTLNNINIRTYNISTNPISIDGALSNTSVEIRVYN